MPKAKTYSEKDLAALAKALRIKSGQRKAQLARALGINRATLQQAEEYPNLSLTKVRQRIIERSRIFVGNTPLPPPLAAGALKALALVRTQPSFRRRLVFNTAYVKAALPEAGVPVNDGPGPIIAIHPRSNHEAQRLRRALLRAEIHPPLIQYQGGAGSAYFRFAWSSEHDGDQLERLVTTIAKTVARSGGRSAHVRAARP